jgi:DNA transformation protein
MALSEEFTEYILDLFSDWGDVSVRKMFGGAGLYRDGKMFGLIADDVVYFKVDDSNRSDYVDADSLPFKPFTNRPTIMSYYEVPPDVLEDPHQILDWAGKSLEIQKERKRND